MAVETVLQWIGTIIVEGEPVTTPMAIYNDIGGLVGYGSVKTGLLSNGTAAQCTALATGGGAGATTTGLGLLAVDVGAAGAAIAPALGVLAGVGLYNLAPDFWADVNNRLRQAGKTIGNKVIAFVNGDGKTCFDEETLDIYKDALLEAEVFQGEAIFPEYSVVSTPQTSNLGLVSLYRRCLSEVSSASSGTIDYYSDEAKGQVLGLLAEYDGKVGYGVSNPMGPDTAGGSLIRIYFTDQGTTPPSIGSTGPYINILAGYQPSMGIVAITSARVVSSGYRLGRNGWQGTETVVTPGGTTNIYVSSAGASMSQPNLQPDATYPTPTRTVPETYPGWSPIIIVPEQEPVYPVEIPMPATPQLPAQNPDPLENPDDYDRWLVETLPIPQLSEDPVPVPTPDPDPSPILTPPDNPTIVTVDDNPIDPNIPPTPNIDPVVPYIPGTVQSTALFTVYNPSIAQLNSLGAYLWSTSILELLERIWQNPLEGIISLRQIYTAPEVGTARNIILGNLDSQVPAPVVTSQFKRFSCGSVTISEKNRNVTDYSPYASVHIYLPFIGIMGLDVDEVMNSTIEIQYCVDVYTGTCLAELYVTRSPDVTVPKILYTFSGNCSQTIPLTSADTVGLLGSLASLSAAAIGTVAGGGAVSAAAGVGIGHSLSHEMLHIGHSGSLSANAGIMGQKKPYVIIGRRHGYDANAYNEIYGYPVNKTVYLGNCGGFTRIKAINLQSSATEQEKTEIKTLLQNGVIL